ncbi:pol_mlvav ame: full=pol polyprotein contains: [Lynx pardinus]|uniref:Pol polyprotein contains n=1 Tax=Lynx pardinus TaxID=191816 RepID=A0A485P2Z6_LYNPA|nr:pol_mlvav ame: full=pol polyprotein contains: [Lynx pardinus]
MGAISPQYGPQSCNPAARPDLSAPLHDCWNTGESTWILDRPTNWPLPNAEATWFTDGSSFVWDGHRYAGAAVVTETNTIWAEALPSRMSAQRAELIILTKALMLGAGKWLNIYTDRRYAFATAHIHGAIYQERGLLTAEGRTIKNKQEILDLLTALWLPARLAIIHCQGHQKADNPVARGHNLLSDANLLWSTVVGAYHVLNTSRPNLTKSCWLCLDVRPPYYEGIAIKGNYTTASNSSSCRWQQTTARLSV